MRKTLMALLAVLFLVACSNSEKDNGQAEAPNKSPAAKLAARAPRIEVSSLRLLGEASESRFDSAQLYEKVSGYLGRKRKASARRLVERFPELSSQLLRNCYGAQASDKVNLWIALFHDDQLGAKKQQSNWYRTLTKRSSSPKEMQGYQRMRGVLKQALSRGEPKLLPEFGGGIEGFGNQEALEAYELRGLTYLLGEDSAKAIADFEKVVTLGKDHDPQRAAQGSLWLSDALRRQGSEEASIRAWNEAVELASALLIQKRPLCSPLFWERAAYLRPAKGSFPKMVTQRLGSFLGYSKDKDLKGELLLWVLLAQMRDLRKEPKAALLAAKKAQALCEDPEIRRRLQILEAKALLGLERPGAAQSVLASLAAEKSPEATALLGALAVQRGELKDGFLLLRGALTQGQDDWSGKAKAEGDLGLAYLLLGHEEKGRGWLHKAQESFERRQNNEALAQSLRNEARYLKFKDREDEALILLKRVAELEN